MISRHSITPTWHALPASERLFAEPLYLTHAGCERIAPHQPYPKTDHLPYCYFTWEDGRVLGDFCLVLVLDGSGEFQTRRGRRRLLPGDVFLTAPGEWHRHRPSAQTGWSIIWIHFQGNAPQRLWKEGELVFPDLIRRPCDETLFRKEFLHLLAEIQHNPASNTIRLGWRALAILAHLIDESPAAPEETDATGKASGDPVVDHAITLIWNHSHDSLGVDEIAELTGTGRRTLERRFRKALGNSVLDEIQRCRFLRASWLLRQSGLPLKIVFRRAGFSSYGQMRQVFLKFAGMSPDVFRSGSPEHDIARSY